ncbi:unnamed protein product, partial [Ascophyllum nodosum]
GGVLILPLRCLHTSLCVNPSTARFDSRVSVLHVQYIQRRCFDPASTVPTHEPLRQPFYRAVRQQSLRAACPVHPIRLRTVENIARTAENLALGLVLVVELLKLILLLLSETALPVVFLGDLLPYDVV